MPAIAGACGLCLIISFLSEQKAGNYNLFKHLPSNLIAGPINYVVAATLPLQERKKDKKNPKCLASGSIHILGGVEETLPDCRCICRNAN
jgi:hypothetical protein